MPLPPGPSAHAAVQLWHWIRRPLDFFDDCAARFGDVFTCRFLGSEPLVIFSKPEHVRAIFNAGPATVPASLSTEVLAPFLGQHSIFARRGDDHERERRRLLPPFQAERLPAYGRWAAEATDEAVDALPVGRPFAAQRAFQDITLRIILRAVFGLEGQSDRERFGRALLEFIDIGMKPWLMVSALRRDLGPSSPWGKFVRARDAADRLIYDELARRRAAGGHGDDVLSHLLAARDELGRPMSDNEVRDELVTLLVAGHETTATALAWTIDALLDNPDALTRLRSELDAAWSEGPPPPERLAGLAYLDAIVREAMRLHPVLPHVGRILARPLRIGDLEMPEGTRVVASIYLTQRRADVFADPLAFRPERFLDRKCPASEWFPFGGGIRRCLGAGFALYEMKIVLATLLARTDLARAPGPSPRVVRRNITLAPSDGLSVIVTQKRAAAARPAS